MQCPSRQLILGGRSVNSDRVDFGIGCCIAATAPIIACLCHRVVSRPRTLSRRCGRSACSSIESPFSTTSPSRSSCDEQCADHWRQGRRWPAASGCTRDYRGTKLSNIVSRVTRILSLRHFDIDWSVSLVRDTPRRKAMIHNTYGLSNSASDYARLLSALQFRPRHANELHAS